MGGFGFVRIMYYNRLSYGGKRRLLLVSVQMLQAPAVLETAYIATAKAHARSSLGSSDGSNSSYRRHGIPSCFQAVSSELQSVGQLGFSQT